MLPSAEEARSDALLVSGKAFQLRGPSVKGVDPDVAALLEDDDDHSLVSGDELEDDFVVIANDGVEKPPAPQLTIDRNKLEEGSLESGTEYSDTSEELELGNENERPGRLLDEQFELVWAFKVACMIGRNGCVIYQQSIGIIFLLWLAMHSLLLKNSFC